MSSAIQLQRPSGSYLPSHGKSQPTYDGWLWIDGYQLAANVDAVARRSLFVMPAGLIWPDPRALHARFLGWLSLTRRPHRHDVR
ncbi:hypothetical protein DLJ58_06030 [Micromonospora arida]|uniref:Uncharacterized protein n=1 Tax=Micromonospora arida TaxID=2203715 RepID=A0A3N9XGZ5_9ACTN|nr:hypothetical protein DLJ58_06030 [Micromonospora arida]